MYEHLILIADDSDFDLGRLEGYLREFYSGNEDRTVNIERMDDRIIVLVERYPFYLTLSDEPHVLEEAQDIADFWKEDEEEKARIRNCSRRLEMYGDGADFNMDYFNDSMFILGEVEQFDGIYIFAPKEGAFV